MPYDSLLEGVAMSLEEFVTLVSLVDTCVPPRMFGVAPETAPSPCAMAVR